MKPHQTSLAIPKPRQTGRGKRWANPLHLSLAQNRAPYAGLTEWIVSVNLAHQTRAAAAMPAAPKQITHANTHELIPA